MDELVTCADFRFNSHRLTTVGLLYLRTGENFRAFDFLGNSLTHDPRNSKTILAAGGDKSCRLRWLVLMLPCRIDYTRSFRHGRRSREVSCCCCSDPELRTAVEQHRHVLLRQAGWPPCVRLLVFTSPSSGMWLPSRASRKHFTSTPSSGSSHTTWVSSTCIQVLYPWTRQDLM